MRVVSFLKTAGKILMIALVCFFATATLIGYFYEKEIKQLVISELNKSLNTKITVGEFDFTVIRHFPNASIEMKEVVVNDASDKNSSDTLLYSKRLSLLFNIRDIFSKQIDLKKILISDGKINIRIDEKGHGNYVFWKKTEGGSDSGEVEINKIGLKNVYLKFTDKKSDQDYALLAKHADLSGKFSSRNFSFTTNADLFIDRLFVHGENYVDHKPVIIRSGLRFDSKSGNYFIDDGKINIAGVPFNAHGKITDRSSDWFLDLIVQVAESDIAKVNSVLPAYFNFNPSQYKAKGKITLNSEIKGSVGKKSMPSVEIVFAVKNGSLSAGDAQLEDINFSGTFRNGDGRKVNYISVPSLTASLSGHKIEASIKLENLPDAYLSLHAQTQLNLGELRPFIKADTLESLSGDLAMNISYAGNIRELKNISNKNLAEVKASGNIDISHVNFKLRKNPLLFKDLNGSFSLHDKDVYVNKLSGNISSTDFHIEGVFKNFVSFLLIPGEPGDMQASMTSNNIDLDELLANKTVSGTNDTCYIMKFNPRLLCEMDVNIKKLQFRRFGAENIKGKVNLEKQVISSRDLQFNSMGGNVVMDATINASRRDSISMIYDTKFSKVDITRLFYEMENFDQQTMTDKNVKGRVSADVQFISLWSKDLTLNSKSVRSTASITVENGELLNFSPVQAMAKYIHVPDLNHIRFSTMKNNISIANRKIYIPNMDINSSAINISGNGTHDFDNNIDYHLALLLSDVLGKKASDNSTEFGEVADDGLGRTKLFLSMKGTVDEPHFSYDKKAAGEKIKNDIVREKQNLKGILKQEFGMYKHEPSVQAPKPKKNEEMQIDWTQE